MHELGDAKVDKHEDSRRRKKAEIVENFKRLFPGVVSVTDDITVELVLITPLKEAPHKCLFTQ